MGLYMILGLGVVLLLCGCMLWQKRRLRDLADALSARDAELQEARASRTGLLAAACHDLRQPAHALGLLADLAAGSADGADRQRTLEGIRRCSAALSGMLGMLLDMTQLEGGHYLPVLEDLPLDELMAEVESQFTAQAASQGQALVARRTGIVVRSDRQLLRRIVFNLVSNAIRHAARGEVELDAWEEGPEVVLLVADNGPGIPPERLLDVVREHPRPGSGGSGGLGIGLAIVQRAAGLLQHEFKLDARPGQGTQASLRLPLVLHPGPGPASPGPPRRGRGELVAMVEDDREAADAAAEFLRRWGFRVFCAPSADALVEALGAVIPALVVSDFQLGDAPDGLEQLRALRRRWPGLPALLLTGDLGEEVATRAALLDVRVAYKPLPPQRLLARIHDTLDARPPRPG